MKFVLKKREDNHFEESPPKRGSPDAPFREMLINAVESGDLSDLDEEVHVVKEAASMITGLYNKGHGNAKPQSSGVKMTGLHPRPKFKLPLPTAKASTEAAGAAPMFTPRTGAELRQWEKDQERQREKFQAQLRVETPGSVHKAEQALSRAKGILDRTAGPKQSFGRTRTKHLIDGDAAPWNCVSEYQSRDASKYAHTGGVAVGSWSAEWYAGQLFAKVDQDDDGSVSKQEMREFLALQIPAYELSPAEIEAICDSADLNDDGDIGYNEFVAFASKTLQFKDWDQFKIDIDVREPSPTPEPDQPAEEDEQDRRLKVTHLNGAQVKATPRNEETPREVVVARALEAFEGVDTATLKQLIAAVKGQGPMPDCSPEAAAPASRSVQDARQAGGLSAQDALSIGNRNNYHTRVGDVMDFSNDFTHAPPPRHEAEPEPEPCYEPECEPEPPECEPEPQYEPEPEPEPEPVRRAPVQSFHQSSQANQRPPVMSMAQRINTSPSRQRIVNGHHQVTERVESAAQRIPRAKNVIPSAAEPWSRSKSSHPRSAASSAAPSASRPAAPPPQQVTVARAAAPPAAPAASPPVKPWHKKAQVVSHVEVTGAPAHVHCDEEVETHMDFSIRGHPQQVTVKRAAIQHAPEPDDLDEINSYRREAARAPAVPKLAVAAAYDDLDDLDHRRRGDAARRDPSPSPRELLRCSPMLPPLPGMDGAPVRNGPSPPRTRTRHRSPPKKRAIVRMSPEPEPEPEVQQPAHVAASSSRLYGGSLHRPSASPSWARGSTMGARFDVEAYYGR